MLKKNDPLIKNEFQILTNCLNSNMPGPFTWDIT
jgi:hypothetical protein